MKIEIKPFNPNESSVDRIPSRFTEELISHAAGYMCASNLTLLDGSQWPLRLKSIIDFSNEIVHVHLLFYSKNMDCNVKPVRFDLDCDLNLYYEAMEREYGEKV